MKNGILILTLLIFITSCRSLSVVRKKQLEAHPEWPHKTVKMIKNGKIAIGFTPDQVKAAWGWTSQVNSTVTKYGSSKTFIYSGDYGAIYGIVRFENGKVVSISN